MITGIILASGYSKRMGREKLLLLVDGLPVVERVIRAVKDSRIDEIVLVYRKKAIKALGHKYGLKVVYNREAATGQSAAVKLGIKASNSETNAYMFLVGDQPFLTSAVINTLIDAFTGGDQPIVVPMFEDGRGNPVIFSSSLKGLLLKLEGDQGGRQVIECMKERVKMVPIEAPWAGSDVDTPEDFEKLADFDPAQ